MGIVRIRKALAMVGLAVVLGGWFPHPPAQVRDA